MLKMLKEHIKLMSKKKYDVFCDVEVINPIDLLDLQYIVDLCVETKESDDKYGFGLSKLNKLGCGSQGAVYEYGKYAIKKIHSDAYTSRDIEVLKEISHLDFIPTLYAVIDDNILIMEKIEGETIYEYCASPDYTNPLNLEVTDMHDQLDYALIEIMKCGFEPRDTHDENVMICFETKKLKIIDVGFFLKTSYNIENYSLRTDEEYINAMDWVIFDRLKPYIIKCNNLSKCNI